MVSNAVRFVFSGVASLLIVLCFGGCSELKTVDLVPNTEVKAYVAFHASYWRGFGTIHGSTGKNKPKVYLVQDGKMQLVSEVPYRFFRGQHQLLVAAPPGPHKFAMHHGPCTERIEMNLIEDMVIPVSFKIRIISSDTRVEYRRYVTTRKYRCVLEDGPPVPIDQYELSNK